jgi:hypothetical protein
MDMLVWVLVALVVGAVGWHMLKGKK